MSAPQKRSSPIAILLLLGIALVTAAIAAFMAYFLLALITPRLFISLSLAGVVWAAVVYCWFRLLASHVHAMQSRQTAVLWTAILTLLIAGLVAFPTLRTRMAHGEESDEQLIAALFAHTIPLHTVTAENGFTDLQPLRPILEDRRIVALGEASHGTSEFFQMKHRLLEFLVCEMDYQHFGMELSPADGRHINAYIMGEKNRPETVLYWPWATLEVMEMIEWMRRYNAQPHKPAPLTFHGIDARIGQRDRIMADNVSQILHSAGADSKIVLWAHNAHIARSPGWMGYYLKEEFADDVYLLGFEFDHGDFTSRMATVHTYSVPPTPPDFYAHDLARLDNPTLFLDFATMLQEPRLHTWLATDRRSWRLQEIHAFFRLHPNWHTWQTSWLQLYDGLIFIEESTPAVSLPHHQEQSGQRLCQQ